MGNNPAAHLFAQLVSTLHDESDALIANDAARLATAGNRKEHLLRLLAPQANALRAMRRSGSDELERFAREAAQLAALDPQLVERLADGAGVSGRVSALRAAQRD